MPCPLQCASSVKFKSEQIIHRRSVTPGEVECDENHLVLGDRFVGARGHFKNTATTQIIQANHPLPEDFFSQKDVF